jgi:hypothetical protein
MKLPLLPMTRVGSYSQPDWFLDRDRLGERLPARVRAAELWRVPPSKRPSRWPPESMQPWQTFRPNAWSSSRIAGSNICRETFPLPSSRTWCEAAI